MGKRSFTGEYALQTYSFCISTELTWNKRINWKYNFQSYFTAFERINHMYNGNISSGHQLRCGPEGMWKYICSFSMLNLSPTFSFPSTTADSEFAPWVQWFSCFPLEKHVGVEKAMATHLSTLAWKIPWVEEPGRLQSTGSWRVRYDWATSLHFTLVDKDKRLVEAPWVTGSGANRSCSDGQGHAQ